MRGVIIVDEVHRFQINDVRLKDNSIHIVGTNPASVSKLKAGVYHIVVYGEDGTVISESRSHLAWEKGEAGTVTFMLPLLMKPYQEIHGRIS